MTKNATQQWISELWTKYRLKLSDYMALLRNGDYRCYICRNPEKARTKSGKLRKLSVDHHHFTGIVRGLLCSSCNCSLGHYTSSFNNQINHKFEQYLKLRPR